MLRDDQNLSNRKPYEVNFHNALALIRSLNYLKNECQKFGFISTAKRINNVVNYFIKELEINHYEDQDSKKTKQ
jgi:hypothetical protein